MTEQKIGEYKGYRLEVNTESGLFSARHPEIAGEDLQDRDLTKLKEQIDRQSKKSFGQEVYIEEGGWTKGKITSFREKAIGYGASGEKRTYFVVSYKNEYGTNSHVDKRISGLVKPTAENEAIFKKMKENQVKYNKLHEEFEELEKSLKRYTLTELGLAEEKESGN